MGMLEWARREVELACKRGNPDRKTDEFDYGCACYESALKAFESLMEDGHSGMSIGFTKQILMRLIDGKPLTPIEDTDDIWEFVFVHDDVQTYQCKRMSSLFKEIHPDGSVTYSDNERVDCIDCDTGSLYYNGFIKCIVEKADPITMPYISDEKHVKVYTKDFLCDEKSGGDYDTRAILYYEDAKGIKHDISRYFKCDKEEPEEIDVYEYLERKQCYEERVHKSC